MLDQNPTVQAGWRWQGEGTEKSLGQTGDAFHKTDVLRGRLPYETLCLGGQSPKSKEMPRQTVEGPHLVTFDFRQ